MANPGQLYNSASSQTRGRSDKRGDKGRSASRSTSRSRSRSSSVFRRLMGKKPKEDVVDDDRSKQLQSPRKTSSTNKDKDKDKKSSKVKVKVKRTPSNKSVTGDEESVYSKNSRTSAVEREPKTRKVKSSNKKKKMRRRNSSGNEEGSYYGDSDGDGEAASVSDDLSREGGRSTHSEGDTGASAAAHRSRKRRTGMKKSKPSRSQSSSSELESLASMMSGGSSGERHSRDYQREQKRRSRSSVNGQQRSRSRSTAGLEASSSSMTYSPDKNRNRSRSTRNRNRMSDIAVPTVSGKGAELMDDLDNMFPDPGGGSSTRKTHKNRLPRRGSFSSMNSLDEAEEVEHTNDYADDDDIDSTDGGLSSQREMQAAIQRGMSMTSRNSNNNNSGRSRSDRQNNNNSSRSKSDRQSNHADQHDRFLPLSPTPSTGGRPPVPKSPYGEMQKIQEVAYAEAGSWRKRAEDSGITLESDGNRTSSKRQLGVGIGVGDNETVHSLSETVASLTHQLDAQRDETMNLQKKLSEALGKVASLSEDLRREESAAMKTDAYLKEAKNDLSTVLEEKMELTDRVSTMENDTRAKDERIERLQQVVETQLDTLEFLEDKLEKTEDELFKMEDEFKALEDEGHLDKSVHTPKYQDRVEKMTSIRTGRLTRKQSLTMERQKSRRILTEKEEPTKRPPPEAAELAEREKKIENRERELLLQREDLDRRETRLEEWEQELMRMDEQIKIGDGLPGDVATNKEKLLERRERRLEESRAQLQREKAAWSERLLALEREKLDVSSGMTMLEKEQQVKALKISIENLEKEKAALLERNQREDRLYDYPKQLHKLETENKDLRQKLDESNHLTPVQEDEVQDLKDEIETLKKKLEGSIDPEEYMQHMQDEIAEQLNELDDENQKLNDRLLAESERFEKEIKSKEQVIGGLEESLENLKQNVSSGGDTADQVSSLLEEIAELKKANHELSGGEPELAEALSSLEKKEELIQELEEKLSKADRLGKMNATNRQEEDDGKDLLIRELQNQLVDAKKQAHALSSGEYMNKLKVEVKKLKEGYSDLKKRLKQEKASSKALRHEKDEAIESMQEKISKLQMALERFERREKNLGSDSSDIGEGSLQQHIEDLENEIDHWKTTNAELENELNIVKSEASDWKAKAESRRDNDEISLGSVHSQASKNLQSDMFGGSSHSLGSLSADDLFFVSDSASVRSQRTAMSQSTSNLPPGPPTGPDEPSTPSQRALRSVSNLWSKVRNNPPPPPGAGQANPAVPYSMRSLDDD